MRRAFWERETHDRLDTHLRFPPVRALRVRAILYVLVAVAPQCCPSSLVAQAEADSIQAVAHLDRARVYVANQDYADARKEVEAALDLAPGTRTWEPALDLLREVAAFQKAERDSVTAQARTRQTLLLDEAKRLIDHREFGDASTLVKTVIREATDTTVLTRANKLLASTHPSLAGEWFLERVRTVGQWTVSVLILIAVLIVVWALAFLARCVYRKLSPDRVRLFGISDSSSLGIRDLVLQAFTQLGQPERLPTAGLMKLERLTLPLQPIEVMPVQEVDLSEAFDALPPVGGITAAALATAARKLWTWIRLQPPWIQGAATIEENHLRLRLTYRSAANESSVVIATADMSDPVVGIRVAEEAAYKMYYYLGHKTAPRDEQAAAELLREGVMLLREHESGAPGPQLDEALKKFTQARVLAPQLQEIQLYEGITLDLLERHDEAVRRFAFLEEHADGTLKSRAEYNLAISLFRQYRPEALRDAYYRLEALGGDPTHARLLTPLEALATAARANVVAHYLIHWYRMDGQPRTRDATQLLKYKKEFKSKVEGWINLVMDLTGGLQPLSTPNPKETDPGSAEWDEAARDQLRWAIYNARGNAFLNTATGYLNEPFPPDSLSLADADLAGLDRSGFLTRAKRAFRECEQTLPAGVETLTNLATVLLNCGDLEESRTYSGRAIALNPSYEYAYYRLAGAWQAEHRADKVIEVLKSYRRPPRISGFQELYREHYVRPPTE